MAHETAIEFVEVFKSFEAQPVLKGLDLWIPRSEITTILGPSGCGKKCDLKACDWD